jgi:hypothetical protein
MLLQRTRSAVAKVIPVHRRESRPAPGITTSTRASLARAAAELGLTDDEYRRLLQEKRKSLKAR